MDTAGFGPFPPVGIWWNLAGYLLSLISMIYIFYKSELIEADIELASAILISLVLSAIWIVLLPMIALFYLIFFSIKGIRKLKELR